MLPNTGFQSILCLRELSVLFLLFLPHLYPPIFPLCLLQAHHYESHLSHQIHLFSLPDLTGELRLSPHEGRDDGDRIPCPAV